MTSFSGARGALAFIPAMLIALPPAAAQDTAKPHWTSISLRDQHAEKAGLLRRARPVGEIAPWVTAANFPADLPAGNSSGRVTLHIAIDTNDRITDCQAEGSQGLSPHLAIWACERVRRQGKFRHALSADGKSMDDVITMTMTFNLDSDPLLMAPPALTQSPEGRDYPYRPDIKLVTPPDQIAPDGTALTGSTIIRVSLFQNPDGTLDTPSCTIVRSSDVTNLDKASCAWAAGAQYAFITPGSRYGAMQIRLRWKKGRVKIEYPDRDRMIPIELRFDPPFVAPASLPFSESGYFAFTFHPGGKVGCQVLSSTGNDALDLTTCSKAVAHARFKPEVDIFGEEVPTRIVYQLWTGDGMFHSPR